jgi:hypothetical protein
MFFFFFSIMADSKSGFSNMPLLFLLWEDLLDALDTLLFFFLFFFLPPVSLNPFVVKC